MAPPTKTILIATTDEDKDTQIANLKAEFEKKDKEAKVAMDEKEKVEAKLKANEEENKKVEGIVANLKAAWEDEKDEAKKAQLKSATEIFEKQQGTSVKGESDEDKEKTAVIASLSAKVGLPIIEAILTAKRLAGATEEMLKDEQVKLTALTLPALEKEYASNQIFIESSLAANQITDDSSALTAAFENNAPFNGITNGPLVGKTINLDEIISEASA